MRSQLFVFIVAFFSLVVITSCTATLPVRFEHFVDKVEKHSDSFSKENWEEIEVQYRNLHDEYKKEKESLSPQSKNRVRLAISRYQKIKAKYVANSIVDASRFAITEIIADVNNMLMKSPLPKCFEIYVSSIEKIASNFTVSDWDMANQGLKILLDKYSKKKDALTKAEKSRINKSIAKYILILTKNASKQIVEGFREMLRSYPVFEDEYSGQNAQQQN